MIPNFPHPNLVFTGDKLAGASFIKQGRVQLKILREKMAERGNQQVGRRFVNLFPGVSIEVKSSFGNDTITIHVSPPIPPKRRGGAAMEEEWLWYWYAFSVAMKIDPDDPTGLTRIPINGGHSLADVAVDKNGDVYGVGYYNTSPDTSSESDEELSNDPVILKYNTDGVFKGVVALDGEMLNNVNVNESGSSVSIDFTVDPNEPLRGGIYFTYDVFAERIQENYDVGVMKTTKDCVKKWSRLISVPETENKMLLSWGSCTDSYGSVFVVGLMNIWENTYPFDFKTVEAFICSLSFDGTLNWIKHLGYEDPAEQVDSETGNPNGLQASMGQDVCVDYNNSAFLVGNMTTVYSDSMGGVLNPSGMIVKFSNQGDVLWKRGLLGLFRQDNGEITHYGLSSVVFGLPYTGITVGGCDVDDAGDIYCSSWASIALSSTVGYHHLHIFKVSSSGNLLWIRVIEIPYFTQLGSYAIRTRLSVGQSGVYVTFPRPENPTEGEPQGSYLFKLQKSDNGEYVLGGDIIWQRLLTFDPVSSASLFGEVSGIFVYSLEVDNRGDLYLGGEIMNSASTFMAKLPGSGGFLGHKNDLMFTDPGVVIYSNRDDVPV